MDYLYKQKAILTSIITIYWVFFFILNNCKLYFGVIQIKYTVYFKMTGRELQRHRYNNENEVASNIWHLIVLKGKRGAKKGLMKMLTRKL